MAMTYRKPMTRIVMLKTGSVLSKTKSYRKTAPSVSSIHTKNVCIIKRPVQGAHFATRPARQNVTEVFQCEKRKIGGKEKKTKYFHTPEVIPSPKAKVRIMAINKILKPNIFFIIT